MVSCSCIQGSVIQIPSNATWLFDSIMRHAIKCCQPRLLTTYWVTIYTHKHLHFQSIFIPTVHINIHEQSTLTFDSVQLLDFQPFIYFINLCWLRAIHKSILYILSLSFKTPLKLIIEEIVVYFQIRKINMGMVCTQQKFSRLSETTDIYDIINKWCAQIMGERIFAVAHLCNR